MPARRSNLLLGGGLALAVAASWTMAYRLGTGAGHSLAVGITGGEVAATPAESRPAESPRAAAQATRPRTEAAAPAAPPQGAAANAPAAPAEAEDAPGEPGGATASEAAVSGLLNAVKETAGRGLLEFRLSQAAQQLGLADIPQAVDALAALPAGPKREAALLAVVERWAQLSPEEAVTYAAAEAVPILRNQMIQATFSGWARRDPVAALAYLDQNPDWTHKETAGQALFEAVGELPAGDALLFLEQVDQDRNGSLTHRTISRLLELDPVAVREWGEGLPEGSLRETVLARSLTAWAEYDPTAARDWMVANYDEATLAAQLPRLASVWARHAPEEARDWYLDLPAEQQTARVGGEVFESWLREDGDGARAYLDSARPQPELDPGFQEYAYQVQRRDPSRSMELAANILDDRMRAETQSRVARYWAQRDPKAALDYLNGSAMPAPERDPLVNYAQSRLNQRSPRGRR